MNENDTVVATEQSPITVQEETGATDQSFFKAHLAFLRQAMKTLEALFVYKVQAHTRTAIADIRLSRPQEEGSEYDNALVCFGRRSARSEMLSFWSMEKIEMAVTDAVMSHEVVPLIAEEVTRLAQLMNQIPVFVRHQIYHRLQVRLGEERFFHRREILPTGEAEHVPSWHGPRAEKKDETELTANSSDSDELRRDRPTRHTRWHKKGLHRDSWADNEPLPSCQSEKLEDETDLRLKMIRPANPLFMDALYYRTYRPVNRNET